MKIKLLIIYTNNGTTYAFNNVEQFNKTSDGITFIYKSKSTETINRATFLNIAGYSKEEK